jgi:hypothetical protein
MNGVPATVIPITSFCDRDSRECGGTGTLACAGFIALGLAAQTRVSVPRDF